MLRRGAPNASTTEAPAVPVWGEATGAEALRLCLLHVEQTGACNRVAMASLLGYANHSHLSRFLNGETDSLDGCFLPRLSGYLLSRGVDDLAAWFRQYTPGVDLDGCHLDNHLSADLYEGLAVQHTRSGDLASAARAYRMAARQLEIAALEVAGGAA